MDQVEYQSLPTDERHPSGEQILLFVDGELPSREAAEIHSHLELCWSCRARRARIENSIADFMEFDAAVLAPHTSVPPRRWSGFDHRLRREVDTSGRPSVLARVREFFHPPIAQRTVAVAAVLALAGTIWWRAAPRATVSAESVFDQVHQRENAWPY